ncbi:glycosyltransferase [Proteus mirabilis]|uniref:glycosyltransferase n=1 Tax=Proteus mirabilis TaxID=584 RepID=UPI0019D1200B|nr:glycosyltransferase [Proteus mirabilis]MBI6487224.1 glycosyltransferase [Proteus mirabilis]MBN7151506.1 glycosyltransferase [Proteus mirabilis]MBN7155105.1 glycosyltransferase [Proteus mirabilis]MBN7167788.1 glycosyltransferase [Proteus mirabilis]MBN7170759.1 glycosyltransferase [Proteus mirabilis]
MLNIVINATALKSGGALSILKQFIDNTNELDIYHIIISSEIYSTLPRKNNIIYHVKDNNSFLQRIYWDSFSFKRYVLKKNINADIIISLQNTSINFKNKPQLIYLHQGLFLHEKRWSFIKKEEIKYAIYKYIYPFFIFLHTTRDTTFVVQTQWMKDSLIKRFSIDPKKIYNLKPTVILPEELSGTFKNIVGISKKNEKFIFYPATNETYKNHVFLLESFRDYLKKNQDSKLKLILTLNREDNKKILNLLKKNKILDKHVIFLGSLSYEDVIILYNASNAIMFPSSIESFGLPLIEAAYLGKKIISLKTSFSQEILNNYLGVTFLKKDLSLWSKEFEKIEKKEMISYPSYKSEYVSEWNIFFKLIGDLCSKTKHY